MFRKILVAYDGSKGAEAALEKGAELCKLTGAELMVLTVYRHHSILEASLSMVRGSDESGASLDDAMRAVSREAAEHAKARAGELGVESVHAFIKGGPSARTIVSFAEEKGCDLIVVGSRGLGASEGYMLGSVSHKVTSLTSIPVLVI
ncbi:Nucleotide-binding universal stress protein, UspA family [Roseovarius pacificus]|uniref:Nucleotide-binding universal stress protein, UspA family n=1 Tax=Roseovarius pacificus TaxID=337701 RepID=A0A1M6XYH9_9RHOB|nr:MULTISPECIES: universal stress protein [Roseovarius]MBU3258597.1 universal stress protein [Roseovarius sp. PS-C2]MDW3119188.1 universal stress protein [Roseovarius pacificus]GGO51569.1 universal stress protein YxiE [Roseovarius pacificus]SHL11064.1 Nucleotide-binding universal stress protein, UspA family [Roseovarius pacificus]